MTKVLICLRGNSVWYHVYIFGKSSPKSFYRKILITTITKVTLSSMIMMVMIIMYCTHLMWSIINCGIFDVLSISERRTVADRSCLGNTVCCVKLLYAALFRFSPTYAIRCLMICLFALKDLISKCLVICK